MKKREFLKLMKKIDPRYLREADARAVRSVYVNQQEDFMRRMTHPLVTLSVCAALVCSIVGTVWFLQKDAQYRRNPHGTGYTAVGMEGNIIDAELTGPPCQNTLRIPIPDMNFVYLTYGGMGFYQQLAVSDTGWYTVGNPSQKDLTRGVCYSDAATGETVYLCAKPECLHDGSDYCPATNADYDVKRLVWYEGVLYGIAHKHTHNPEKPDAFVLLAYQPDGTGMQELEILDDRGEPNSYEIIAHRGALWITGTVQEKTFTGDEALGIESYSLTLYYGIWHYEIAKSRLTVFAEGDTTSLGNLQADGDYVYTIKRSSSPYYGSTNGIYRIHAQNGTVSWAKKDLSFVRDYYMVSDNRLLWVERAETPSPETREIYELHTLEDETETIVSVPRGEMYFTDGIYLFVSRKKELLVCDLEGNILKQQTFPREKNPRTRELDEHSFAYTDGMLYHIRTEHDNFGGILDSISHIESVPLADYLSGDADFAPLLETHDIDPITVDLAREIRQQIEAESGNGGDDTNESEQKP